MPRNLIVRYLPSAGIKGSLPGGLPYIDAKQGLAGSQEVEYFPVVDGSHAQRSLMKGLFLSSQRMQPLGIRVSGKPPKGLARYSRMGLRW